MSSPAQGAETPTESPEAPPRRHGRMFTVGLIAALVCVVAGVAVGVAAVLTHGFRGRATVEYRQAAVFSVRVGDCIDLTPAGTVVHVVSCAKPHDAEIFGTFHLGGTAWPGDAKVRQEAASGCTVRLGGYLNPQLSSSNLTQSYVYPGQQAWKTGERTVICEVRAIKGSLTGSVRSGG
ncbi:MAG TPA: septum formation family protein [Streptosporangiaceae bacterium]|nr:septum formation family protein [Streptosporangiaceae bacterium]